MQQTRNLTCSEESCFDILDLELGLFRLVRQDSREARKTEAQWKGFEDSWGWTSVGLAQM